MALKPVMTYHTVGGVAKRRGSAATPPEDPNAITLLYQNFNAWTLGVGGTDWNASYWNSQMGGGMGTGNADQHPRHKCMANPDLGGRMMQVSIIGGAFGTAGATALAIPLSTAVKRIRFRCKYKLVAPYTYGLGQKHPGPSATYPGESIDYPGGCKVITDQGGSFRLMHTSNTGRPDGTGIVYIYGKDVSDAGWNCGEDGWMTSDGHPSTGAGDLFNIPTGQWNEYTTDVTLNDPGIANGFVSCDFNGAVRYTRSNRLTRTRSDVLFRGWMWEWFHGGNDASWAPPSDQFVWIDEVEITGWVV